MNTKNIAQVLLLAGACGGLDVSASNISQTHFHAYGANIGWINWRPTASTGATLSASFLGGDIWAANVGWISLGDGVPANGFRYQNQSNSDFGVNVEQDGTLSGYAYGANIGWIRFTDTSATGTIPESKVPRVDLKTGKFFGFAYSANCGWIDLGSALGCVKATGIDIGPDTDSDGIPDAWEKQQVGDLTQLGAGDLDHDGVSDKDEYAADTNPSDPQDFLRITHIDTPNHGEKVVLTWSSKPSRCYSLEKIDDLFGGNWEGIIPPGLINPDAGATTTRELVDGAVPNRFYRVLGVVPGGNFGP